MNPLCFPVWFITDLYPVYARFMKPLCFTVWFINRRHVPGWRTGWLAGWLAAWLVVWLAARSGRQVAWLADGLPGWLTGCLAGWLAGWMTAWWAGWLAGRAGRLASWLAFAAWTDSLACWPTCRLAGVAGTPPHRCVGGRLHTCP